MNNDQCNSLLVDFARRYFSPTEEERTWISQQYEELKTLLPGTEIFQSGSYRRMTSVTPVHDLDVIWIMPESLQSEFMSSYSTRDVSRPFIYDVSNPLRDLAKHLRSTGAYDGVADIDDTQSHSVSIKFKKGKIKDFSIDVVPAVRSGVLSDDYHTEILLVPELQKMSHRKRGERYLSGEPIFWIETDPKGYIKESERLNTNSDYRKAVKFVKVWRRSCNSSLTNFDLQSFHAELLMAGLFKLKPNLTLYEAGLEYFSQLPTWLSNPRIPDRANPDKKVDEYLNEDRSGSQRLIIATRAEEMMNFLLSMKQVENVDGIYALLREVLIAREPWIDTYDCKNDLVILCEATPQPKAMKKNSKVGMLKGMNVSDYLLKYFNRSRPNPSGEALPANYDLLFNVEKLPPKTNRVMWLIVNNGVDALEKAKIGGWRGYKFEDCDRGNFGKAESTLYIGDHWIDVFAIDIENKCVGRGRYHIIIRQNDDVLLA